MNTLKSKRMKDFFSHIGLLLAGLAMAYPATWLVDSHSLNYPTASTIYAIPVAFIAVGMWAPVLFLPKKIQFVFLGSFFLVFVAFTGKVVESGVNRALHTPAPAPTHTRPAQMWRL